MVERLKELLSTKSMILSGNFFHMRCATHILNLIMKDGLDNVSYWSSSSKQVEKFELACRQMQMDVKKLGLDCPTRWNSTFTMLELAVKYKSVFSRLQTLEPQYKCLPSSEEWELAKQMLDYLRHFSRLTEMFSSTTYPTDNLFFPLVYKMRIALKRWQISDVPAVKNTVDNMIETFLKYWDEISGVLVMAVILDSRYKMMLINYYYPKIYVVGLENQFKRVRELCDEMMNYYKAKSTTTRYGVVIKRTLDFDVLQWWKMNKGKYPILAEMAKDLLAIPVTTVALESAFSMGGRTLSPYQSGVPEEEMFIGEELKDEDKDGPQILD
ncbi:BED-type domain-containing protein [Citrus sinensis]|uniref:BED-type domain-containing protein n=1 Tax=Citrus sinensis TaxID=2711 RepID=A0ACB8JVJ4_CITSI|nr:BED-type domain-containing protein [Citrus sinensis]